jgi:branched-chain amino acid transport system ATP-binding protein
VLSVEGLRASIGSSEILRGVSLSVAAGEVTCLLGRNGAGKTTLLRTVMGYLRPSAGRVLLAGRDVTGWAPHRLARAGVGFSPEDSGVFAGLTVEENIRVATWAKPGGRPAEERVALARSVFPALARNWSHRGAEMSGGERKMLSIGRALATDPDLLILDEPFEGLSPAVIPEVAEGIAAITATGRSILLAESNAYHVPPFASSVYVLERGEVVFSGPPEAMAEDQAVRRIVEGMA